MAAAVAAAPDGTTPRTVMVEMNPTPTLAMSAMKASMRTLEEAPAAAAVDVVAAVGAALPAGFRLDTSFPATPVPQPVPVLPDTAALKAFAGEDAFDVSARISVDVNPLQTPYVVRGVIENDAQLEALAASPAVRAVYADPPIQPFLVCPGSAPVGTHKDVARLLCTDRLAAAGMDGSGVLVAIVDTGINLEHLRARGLDPSIDRARSWKPATALGEPFEFPADHGTMCAFDALIAAPRATLLDIPVLLSRQMPGPGESPMGGLLSDAVLAYSHLLGILRAQGDQPGGGLSLVVSNSWGIFSSSWDFPPGHPGNYTDNPDHPFNRIVTTLERFGADILFAAGNCGVDCPDGRCAWRNGESTITGANSHPAVISVAGVDTTGERAGYSSTGPGRLMDRKPDISGFTHFQGSGVFAADGGTSAACPVVAGVVAAVRSRIPSGSGEGSASPAAIRDMLFKSALERGNPGYDYAYGWGIVNGCRLSELVPASAPSAAADASAIEELAMAMRGTRRTLVGGPAMALGESVATTTGKKVAVVAHLVAKEDIKTALITTLDDPGGVDFAGSDRDQKATVSTDEFGELNWSMSLQTNAPFANWSLTFTKKGDEEKKADASGRTNDQGIARPTPRGIKQF